MISRIGLESTSKYNNKEVRKQNGREQDPNFKGIGSFVLGATQACEKMPMVNVAVIDMLSAILPRTIVESMTNFFAGFEAFRRESSGLIVNCLIPSFIVYCIARCINGLFMPKGANLAKCWADSSLIDHAAKYYENAKSDDKTKDALKQIISDIQGTEGSKHVEFSRAFTEKELDEYAQKLANYSRTKEVPKYKNVFDRIASIFKKDKKLTPVEEVVNDIIEKTRVAENIKVVNKSGEVKASSVGTLLSDSVKFFREYEKVQNKSSIESFAKQSKKLVRAKSLLGFSVVLPLAASMQYINRWYTSRISGVKGAPIYDDFAKGNKSIEQETKDNKGLLKEKIKSISAMLGVGLLSMMKLPSMTMLEFKGMFPTMDQARIISMCTFSSRMAAADDKNELKESKWRDIATFCGLYFFGDYAAKGAATVIQNTTGVSLLNDTKPLDKNAGIVKKTWHWIKDLNIKSSDEVVSKTEEALKKSNLKPTQEQLITINKELAHARNLRSYCQWTNIGVSLALLGIVIPIFTRKNTKKQHEQALKLAQENMRQSGKESHEDESVTPLNIEYSRLTAGFRSEQH